MSYSAEFYDAINSGSVRSARKVVPWVKKLVEPKDVIDIGCGEGAWLQAFEYEGVSVRGVDGAHVDRSRLLIDEQKFMVTDLNTMIPQSDYRFDLVMSLEVAEHLPPNKADRFVELLTRKGDTILFSAAIPGQSGLHHINCQWPSYWVELFAKRGYACRDDIRWAFWNDQEVEPWYRQNMLMFVKGAESNFKGDVVHPEIYRWHYRGNG